MDTVMGVTVQGWTSPSMTESYKISFEVELLQNIQLNQILIFSFEIEKTTFKKIKFIFF